MGRLANTLRWAKRRHSRFNIIYEPVLVKDLRLRKGMHLPSGQQHLIALDEKGMVHACATADTSKLVWAIRSTRSVPKKSISSLVCIQACSSSQAQGNSVIVDKGGMCWTTSEWQNSGNGSSGSPYTSFQYILDIKGFKITAAASGGVTYEALTSDEDSDGVTTVCGG
ncbi:hypothetical protein EDD18DRAFT_698150 [Armillaria luteobubalina]|uniref:Uncharacterized protein n=1 Tax=Armillaria luteobubalina TaxID=153913 RepID=A0AA39PKR0_9AGAR|nr:hypothetical protein EDD18DRAFT_698150 [Armillaria luteobubalina]